MKFYFRDKSTKIAFYLPPSIISIYIPPLERVCFAFSHLYLKVSTW